MKSVLGNSPWQKEGLGWLQLLDAVRLTSQHAQADGRRLASEHRAQQQQRSGVGN